jgi:hypothetical protein
MQWTVTGGPLPPGPISPIVPIKFGQIWSYKHTAGSITL